MSLNMIFFGGNNFSKLFLTIIRSRLRERDAQKRISTRSLNQSLNENFNERLNEKLNEKLNEMQLMINRSSLHHFNEANCFN